MEFSKVQKEIFNPIAENVKKLAQLFPAAVKDGQVDLEALKAELGQFESVSEKMSERYELGWVGKEEAKKLANQDVVGRTLKYVPEESKHPETTENLYIEGDNLEVLKLLRNSYYNKVKMIYIDPPYNTGNDFIYKDNFAMNQRENSALEGEIDEMGERLIVNQKSNGRYHSNWLSMMYPRLKVAKDLLKEDGVIFISIDDNEHSNLKLLCDEVFGSNSFIGDIVWRSSDNSNNNALTFSEDHNYILVYAKSPDWKPNFLNNDSKRQHFKNPDNDPRGPWFDGNPVNNPGLRPNLQFDIITPSGKLIKHPPNGWRWSKETIEEKLKTGELRFSEDETRLIRRTYLYEMKGLPPSSLCIDLEITGHTRRAKYELKKLFPEVPVTSLFSTPKPTLLLKYILTIASDNNAIVLDFFSGSATSADAVMQLNAEDGGKRKFIMVQLPEVCESGDYGNAVKLKNICEIGKERIRRAGDKIIEENKDKKGIENLDIGFKVFKVADTNIRWFSEAMKSDQMTLDESAMTDKDRLDFTPGFTDLDVVYEILLRHRDIPLSSKVEKVASIGERTYIFADTVLVCLEENVTESMIDKIAAIEPMPTKIIFRDSAFGADISLKTNSMLRLEAQMKKNSGLKKKAYRVEFI
ncbi:DNA methylase [Heliomicrobium modesticaldum Ice1]|uniref:DNA methylase n=1 Tax=Heliobacterium modesticaldum (strain ATCC 51547 / Ice1) TaxID=498761 RepID=B0TDI8_HELMI|nr:site-specific DNA-methyltransferase [Heliomicrobium modesticaldum]ABZ85513.1 DNA methylase [Heliomicrobium modesticaldum Ice1]